MTFMRKTEKGFTLIEVMLVVIIIGIIAIIALPKLLVTRDIAQDNSCLSNLQSLRTAIEQYKLDSPTNAYPLAADDTDGVLDTLIAELETPINGATQNYIPANSDVSASCPGTGTNHGIYQYLYVTGEILCGENTGITPIFPGHAL